MSPTECKRCDRLERIVQAVMAEIEDDTVTKSWLTDEFMEMATEVCGERMQTVQ